MSVRAVHEMRCPAWADHGLLLAIACAAMITAAFGSPARAHVLVRARALDPAPRSQAPETTAPAASEASESPSEKAGAAESPSGKVEAGDIETSDAAAPQAESDEAEEEKAPFSITAGLETSVGQGSFVADENARNAYAAYTLSLVPAYRVSSVVKLSAFVSAGQELTESDGDTHSQQLLLSDSQLRARFTIGTIPAAEIDVAAEGRLYLPTSLVSQHETLALGSQARLILGRDIGPVSIGWLSAFRKNFHVYESPVLDLDDDGTPPPMHVRAGGNEDLGGGSLTPGGNNVSYSFLNELSVGYKPLEPLELGISYGLSHAFTYASFERDELSSPYADPGRGHRDTAVGTLWASYELDSRFTFSLGVSTTAAPKTADNQSFRFPFYDFSSTADNLTTFYLDVTVFQPFGE